LLLVGALVFFLRFSAYFEKGATSLSARFDYWKAAAQVVQEHPLTGSGPGTFGISYRRLKTPESEMARLTHNDYLEQASDSGIPGAAAFLALWLGGLAVLFKTARNQPITFMVWLGLLGYSLQAFMEFSLYIPALAWPAFLLLGWLAGKDAGVVNPDKPKVGDIPG
jgi:O-antigen ligase